MYFIELEVNRLV